MHSYDTFPEQKYLDLKQLMFIVLLMKTLHSHTIKQEIKLIKF